MHQHHVAAELGAGFGRAGRGERRHIVPHRGPGGHRRARHRRLRRIDGDRHISGGADRGDDRDHARDLFILENRVGAGPRRLAADVDPVGAVASKSQRTHGWIISTAIGKAVRRGVDDAHDEHPVSFEESSKLGQSRLGAGGQGHGNPGRRHGAAFRFVTVGAHALEHGHDLVAAQGFILEQDFRQGV